MFIEYWTHLQLKHFFFIVLKFSFFSIFIGKSFLSIPNVSIIYFLLLHSRAYRCFFFFFSSVCLGIRNLHAWLGPNLSPSQEAAECRKSSLDGSLRADEGNPLLFIGGEVFINRGSSFPHPHFCRKEKVYLPSVMLREEDPKKIAGKVWERHQLFPIG